MEDRLTPTQITGLIMYKTGKTIPLFAKSSKVSKSTLYLAINGVKTRPLARQVIADAVGMSESQLWPEDIVAA